MSLRVTALPYLVKLRRKDGTIRWVTHPCPGNTPDIGNEISVDIPGASIVRASVTQISEAYSVAAGFNVELIDLVAAEEV